MNAVEKREGQPSIPEGGRHGEIEDLSIGGLGKPLFKPE
jgi:hypothetical protein